MFVLLVLSTLLELLQMFALSVQLDLTAFKAWKLSANQECTVMLL